MKRRRRETPDVSSPRVAAGYFVGSGAGATRRPSTSLA